MLGTTALSAIPPVASDAEPPEPTEALTMNQTAGALMSLAQATHLPGVTAEATTVTAPVPANSRPTPRTLETVPPIDLNAIPTNGSPLPLVLLKRATPVADAAQQPHLQNLPTPQMALNAYAAVPFDGDHAYATVHSTRHHKLRKKLRPNILLESLGR